MSRNDIAAAMVVRHVMTPIKEALKFRVSARCDDVANDLAVCEFDNAPVQDDSGSVIGHVNQHVAIECSEREVAACMYPMSSSTTIGADARLSELLDRLQAADFLHVVGSAGVVGLVTPSDFNKQAARAYFYLLVSDLEIQLARWLRQSGHAENDLVERLPSSQRKRLEGMLKKQRKADVAADAIAAMYFDDLLYLGHSTGVLAGMQSPFKGNGRSLLAEVNKLRVDVMHVVKVMAVDRRESITRLGRLQQHLQRMLQDVERASTTTGTPS